MIRDTMIRIVMAVLFLPILCQAHVINCSESREVHGKNCFSALISFPSVQHVGNLRILRCGYTQVQGW
jgi:hypothetical protein